MFSAFVSLLPNSALSARFPMVKSRKLCCSVLGTSRDWRRYKWPILRNDKAPEKGMSLKVGLGRMKKGGQTYYFGHVHQLCPVHGHRIPGGSGQTGLIIDCCCWWGAAPSHDARCTYRIDSFLARGWRGGLLGRGGRRLVGSRQVKRCGEGSRSHSWLWRSENKVYWRRWEKAARAHRRRK